MGVRVGELAVRVGRALGDELLALADPEALVDRLLSRARERRFGFEVEDRVFLAYVADRIPEDARVADLDALHVDDLYLACACAARDDRAIAAFEREFAADLTAAVAKVDRGGGHDDVMQQIRTRLFVAEGDQRPRIADYAGRGRLFSWLRVVVVREAISVARKPRREIGTSEIPEAAIDDLELDVFKGLYQQEFKQAFAAAVAGLTARERNLLRLHLIDGLTIDDIGAANHAHRTTAARWLREIRAQLATSTRDRLAASLKLSGGDLDSVMRLVRSRLDLSVSRLLGGE